MKTTPKPIVLFILDGWGHRDTATHNPCINAKTPFIDSLFRDYPHRLLNASGTSVGLPDGQMGNSEVGHLHIGAGRLVRQDLSRITHSINDGTLAKNEVLQEAIAKAQHHQSRIHILGLVSPGGVHSHESHITAMVNIIGDKNIPCYLHAFLDGRDVPPRSAKTSLEQLQKTFEPINGGIASICGRYYAMDRDHRWERTALAYDLLTAGMADYHADTAVSGLAEAYARGENDEFVKPTNIGPEAITIEDNDIVIFMNFRADRTRQLSYALTEPEFSGFPRKKTPHLAAYITLTQYAADIKAGVLFEKAPLENTLGEVLEKNGLHQLRIAETEKYAHVTYFLNGGNETPNAHEDRILIPSPKVATYDLQPEMSAAILTDTLCDAINTKKYDVIICNYANPDMVGHTGLEAAANSAMETMDACLARVITCIQKSGGEALITADHGNIECMYDEKNQQPHTAHTTNLVPLVYVGRSAYFDEKSAALSDLAPTMLQLLHLDQPSQMTGRTLLEGLAP
jgi:2,3-bisphosphoglycerate-independent phosphoglycerate mutase